MEHELAKELKDAGFPQEGKGKYLHFQHEIDDPEHSEWVNDSNKVLTDEEYEFIFYIPTLSELIEACGDRFESLDKLPPQREKGEDVFWRAFARGVRNTRGKTPEEAVARLWLVLNKK